ncbi:hypothetical protein OB955_02105 [Halobacteria archaeon AArc-m2/3/4]|uniref:PEP-CTERM protein-sorting domain-containing protein n=1 Tax=Natronoglomus mannanivorans TaxID=2979990 RepID=A0ABT2Q9D4_9EURY|nr:hypothetical protein [Halobacteria archaeon AArc-m2/3/4]
MARLQRLSALFGVLVVLGTIGVGGWALLINYVFESSGELLTPTGATLLVTVGLVLVLVGFGARSKRRLENPYW